MMVMSSHCLVIYIHSCTYVRMSEYVRAYCMYGSNMLVAHTLHASYTSLVLCISIQIRVASILVFFFFFALCLYFISSSKNMSGISFIGADEKSSKQKWFFFSIFFFSFQPICCCFFTAVGFSFAILQLTFLLAFIFMPIWLSLISLFNVLVRIGSHLSQSSRNKIFLDINEPSLEYSSEKKYGHWHLCQTKWKVNVLTHLLS